MGLQSGVRRIRLMCQTTERLKPLWLLGAILVLQSSGSTDPGNHVHGTDEHIHVRHMRQRQRAPIFSLIYSQIKPFMENVARLEQKYKCFYA